MNTSRTTYAIRVDSHLDDHWSAWLGDLDMTRDDDAGTTTITVSVRPSAAPRRTRPLARHRRRDHRAPHHRCADPHAARRCLSARGTPSASHSVPRPPATRLDSTWRFRQLESVNEWLWRPRRPRRLPQAVLSDSASHDDRNRHSRPRRHGPTHRRLHASPRERPGATRCLDQARDTQALHREKGGLRAPALLRRQLEPLAAARERRAPTLRLGTATQGQGLGAVPVPASGWTRLLLRSAKRQRASLSGGCRGSGPGRIRTCCRRRNRVAG